MQQKRIVTSKNAVLPGAEQLQPATIEIDLSTGLITAVRLCHATRNQYAELGEDAFLDLQDKYLLPGLVDSHVHLNEPGRTEWEGFATGTDAAASGGVTTVCDMPLNAIPPTTTVENLKIKLGAAQGQCRVDVAFWGGLLPNNSQDLVPLVNDGVRGFKCFMIESGVDEFPCVNEAEIVAGLEQLKRAKSQVLYHAEMEESSSSKDVSLPPREYKTFLDSRPEALELAAISLIVNFQERYPTVPMHIVHLSAASALPIIRTARAKGLPLTVETTFHYLCLAAEDIKEGRTDYKCCPPIRNQANRDALWQALAEGDIDMAISDHSPCTSELKRLEEGSFTTAWGGVSGLGLGLSLMHTEGSRRKVGICQLVKWMAEAPAKQLGLSGKKGCLQVGAEGDFVVFDPHKDFTVAKEDLVFKNKLTPYEGLQLKGQVEQTYLRGRLIYDRGQLTGDIMGKQLLD